VIAVVDESTPEGHGGVFYVVTAGIIIEEEPDTARAVLRKAIAGSRRTRPFHWHKEGPAARNAMCEAVDQLGVVAHVTVGHPTARHGQEKARALAFRHVLPRLLADGVDEVLIEQRSERQDQRDRSVILDVLQAEGRAGDLAYQWVPKTEPLVWIADALGGVMSDYLLGRDDTGRHQRLTASGCLAEPIYFRP
jgi:hypothetical protein